MGSKGYVRLPLFGVEQYEFYTRSGELIPPSTEYKPHVSTRYLNNGSKTSDLGNEESRLPELYTKRSDCCGCAACGAVCPVNAIFMLPDEEGFLYPVVDAGLCIGCHRCLKVCAYKTDAGSLRG